VVTEVNGCRYCSWYHSAQSIKAGLSDDELRALLAGQIPDGAAADEIAALVYARHSAQTNAMPDPEAACSLVETYSKDRASMINVILRMIRAGNLIESVEPRSLRWYSAGPPMCSRVHAAAGMSGFAVFTPIRSRYPTIQSSAIADGMVTKP